MTVETVLWAGVICVLMILALVAYVAFRLIKFTENSCGDKIYADLSFESLDLRLKELEKDHVTDDRIEEQIRAGLEFRRKEGTLNPRG